MKKKMLLPFLFPINVPPFADNSAGFSGVFPGSSPDLIGPVSSASLASFSASICLGAGLLFVSKKRSQKIKNY